MCAMKKTGMTRPVDELGRVVIPKEIRNNLGIDVKDRLEILLEGDAIVLKKYDPNCMFCGSTENVEDIMGKNICESCVKKIKSI